MFRNMRDRRKLQKRQNRLRHPPEPGTAWDSLGFYRQDMIRDDSDAPWCALFEYVYTWPTLLQKQPNLSAAHCLQLQCTSVWLGIGVVCQLTQFSSWRLDSWCIGCPMMCSVRKNQLRSEKRKIVLYKIKSLRRSSVHATWCGSVSFHH